MIKLQIGGTINRNQADAFFFRANLACLAMPVDRVLKTQSQATFESETFGNSTHLQELLGWLADEKIQFACIVDDEVGCSMFKPWPHEEMGYISTPFIRRDWCPAIPHDVLHEAIEGENTIAEIMNLYSMYEMPIVPPLIVNE